MQKPVLAASLLAAALFLGNAAAQQTSNSNPAGKPGASAGAPQTQATGNTSSSTLPTQKDKISYAIGMNIGQSMKRDSLDVNPDVLAQGMKDAMAGGKMQMTDDEAKTVMNDLRTQMMAKKQAEMTQASQVNKAAGEKFLAENKAKQGVVTLPSGLQYKVLKEGTGPKPAASDTVVCNYKGSLIDGTEFDNSEKHGGPATMVVGQVIKGWTEALQLMPVGSKWQLVLPPDLAYGERSPGPEIPPSSTLIFEIDLMSIKAAK